MTPNSTKITDMIETGFTYLRDMLAKVEVTVKETPRLRTVSDGNVSLPSSLTGKWLMTLFRCCLVPIIIRSVLSGLSFSLLDSIHDKISVRQSHSDLTSQSSVCVLVTSALHR